MIGHSICKSDWKLHLRTIQEYELVLMYQGEANFTVNNTSFPMSKGDCLLIGPDEPHSAVTDVSNPCRFYYVHFMPQSDVEKLDDDYVRQQISDELNCSTTSTSQSYWIIPQPCADRVYCQRLTFTDAEKDEFFSYFEKALWERNQLSPNSHLMISLYISQILVFLSRMSLEKLKLYGKQSNYFGEAEMPRIIQKAVFYIHENSSGLMCIHDLCRHLEVSSQYLARMFQKKLGISPLQYINHLRIQKAKELMRNTSMTIKEITYAVGMENPYYFSRLFKKVEGIQPTRYLQSLNSHSNE